ncbi:MAG: lysine--tRNA ligase, partial [Pollutimonas bauzanensis]
MNEPTPSPLAIDENHLIAERRGKLAKLRAAGIAYPNDFRPDSAAAGLHKDYDELDKEALAEVGKHVKVAGRMMLKRVMGKASFATLQDSTGRIQIFLDKNNVGEDLYAQFKTWDIGDIVGVEGTVFKTNKGELSVHAATVRLLTKSLRPLPDKFHGVADQELRYRQRYVDLIMTEETRRTFVARSKAMGSIRQFMLNAGFLEVETPMLHPIPGGAAAKPFVTHHNALDMEMFLRIAPELYLKRLVVGGFERVFEVNRNFRNEGVSPRHNPEFTMMEFYAAYTDYRWLMDFTESLIREAAIAATGSAVLTYQEKTLDLSQPFDRLTIVQAILKYAPGYDEAQLGDESFLRAELKRVGADVNGPVLARAGVGGLQLALFEETAEARLWHPTYIIDYPVEVSPLARASDTQAGVTERFELFMTGR